VKPAPSVLWLNIASACVAGSIEFGCGSF